jgi:hypothetical protein
MSENDRVLLDGVLARLRTESAAELREDEFFEAFLAQQVMWEKDLSWDELMSGVMGGGGDGGIDCFYTFCNGTLISSENFSTIFKGSVKFELFILQAKRSASFSETAIDKLRSTLSEVFDLAKEVDDFSVSYNDELIEAIELFRRAFLANASSFPTVEINIVYGTRGSEVHPNVRGKAEALRTAMADMFSDSHCDFRFVTPRDLVTMARRQKPTSFDLLVSDVISTGSGGLIATVKLSDYYQFVVADTGELRQGLLESNVRDYEGPGGINASIRATLEGGGEDDFWWLNNGVTVVAKRAAQFGKKLTLEFPQIVNGLQTTREVWSYCSTADVGSDNRLLLVRVVVPPSEASRDRIIRATNSQTAIPTVALRATDPIQRSIEDYFAQHGYFYERRKNQHQGLGRPLSRVCSIAYLAESVLAVHLLRPHIGAPRLGGRFLRDDKEYNAIFDSSVPLETFLKCFQLTRAVEVAIRHGSIPLRSTKRNSTGRPILAVAGAIAAEMRVKGESLHDLDQEALDALNVSGWRVKIREIEELVRTEGKRRQNESDEAFKIKLRELLPPMFNPSGSGRNVSG